MKKSKKIILIIVLVCLFITQTTLIVVQAAYFIRGKFKDVFINKQDYFSADKLYSISTIDSTKERVVCDISEQSIFVYNHDVSTGDYNAFDVDFDIYVWLTAELTNGKEYTFKHYEGGVEQAVAITTAYANPITSKTLEGGKCSTESFTLIFGYEDGDDLTNVPGINVVAVPTSPVRLSGAFIGATFVPTKEDTCSVTGRFENSASIDDNAAFKYNVQSTGPNISEGKVVLKWNSSVLTLMTVNQSINFTGVEDISEGSFTKQYSWTAKNNNTDTFTFFRNNQGGYWNEVRTWADIEGQVSVEYVMGVE